MEQDINPMPEIRIYLKDVVKAIGAIAARGFSFLPSKTLATHGDHQPSGASAMLDNTLFDVNEY